MPLILGAQSATTATAVVSNSCRFDGSSAYMHKTPSTGDRRKWTLSFWVKLGAIAGSRAVFGSPSDGSNYNEIWFQEGVFRFDQQTGGSPVASLVTDSHFKDPAAWYHIVCVWDSDNAAAGDRMKMYINGVEETSFATDTNPALNLDSYVNSSSYPFEVGAMNTGEYFGGYLAEVVFLDGTAASSTSFGEFDSDSPTIWKPIDVSGLTFGTNGFYLDFEDSANLGNDANGGTDFTEVNLAATDQCTDTPVNNFSTGSPLLRYAYPGSITISEGNTKITDGGSADSGLMSTLGVSAGKWYVEFKRDTITNSYIGVCGASQINETAYSQYIGGTTFGVGLKNDGNIYVNTSSSSFSGTYTNGDVISVALDMDNDKVYFAKDGAWATGSGAWDSTTFDAAVGAQAISTGDDTYVFGCTVNTAATSSNYGNPNYALTSAEADGNGYGNFEYAPPSGYLALCTKNLGSDGG